VVQWEAGGCVVGRLWVLPQRVLMSLCRDVGLPDDGDKVALVRRYADNCRAAEAAAGRRVLALTDAPGSKAAPSSSSASSASLRARQRADAADVTQLDDHELPSNLHALESDQLAAVCAALGLPGTASETKATLIRTIEHGRFKGRLADAGFDAAPQALEDRGDGAATGKRGRRPAAQRLLTATAAAKAKPSGAAASRARRGKGLKGDDDDDDDDDGDADSSGGSASLSDDSDVVFVPAARKKRA
jgi:hypothetical protein